MSHQYSNNKSIKNFNSRSLKKLLCKTIKFGTLKDVQRFRWFTDKIEGEKGITNKSTLYPDVEPLFAVMEKQDAKLYHEILKFDLDLHIRVYPRNMTLLHYAANAGNILAVAMYLYYGLDPEALTSDNEIPIQLAKSRNMRMVFNDFKHMTRSKFAKKYELKIPPQTSTTGKPFPFMELPLEIQEMIWQCVSVLHLWNFQFVSKEWRDYFLRKTNVDSLIDNLFPRGRISASTRIGYYPTEFHFFFANGFFDLSKKQIDVLQVLKEMMWEVQLKKKEGYDFTPRIRAIKKLLEDQSGSSTGFKEKIFATSRNCSQCYYIQKSEYFGIAIEVSAVKLSKEQVNEAKRMMFVQQLNLRNALLDKQLQQLNANKK